MLVVGGSVILLMIMTQTMMMITTIVMMIMITMMMMLLKNSVHVTILMTFKPPTKVAPCSRHRSSSAGSYQTPSQIKPTFISKPSG